MPTFREASTCSASRPPTVTAQAFALGEKIPVSVSPPKLNAGAAAVPRGTEIWPVALTANWLTPPTCMSMTRDAAADAVFVTSSLMP